ncbi:MAG: S9 family peptidase [Chitinophagales bacterium]|nr:S9 family peptidase [Chitinophagales bacterium]
MNRIFLLFFLFFSSIMNSQNAKLIDRELFFGNPEISGSQLSPDGKYVTFLKEYEGIMNLWIKKFDEPFEKAIPLTNQKRPMYGYFWTEDAKFILFVRDNDGDENMNIYAIDPYAGKLPEARNLTPMKDITANIQMVSKKSPNILYVGINNRDKKWHDLYKLNIANGQLEMIYENKERITDFNFDWDETLRLLSKTDEKGNTVTYRIDAGNKLEEIYSTNVKEGAAFLMWNKDNTQVYLETNKGDLDLSELYLMNPKTKQLTLIEKDPKGQVDFGSLFVDDNTREIIYTSYTNDKRIRYWKNKAWEENHSFLETKFPGREIGYASYTNDYSKMLISTYGDKYVPEVYYFDTKTRELTFQYCPRPKLKAIESELVEMLPISYPSSDGTIINGYLSYPKGGKKNLPLIALIHGGPKGPRDNWGYSAEVQFLCNRGFAVFQPNFRASGGYGKKFLNAGDKQWGKLMQDDITWGVKHLITNQVADPKKLVIMGGSYGGYATLAGITFTPDLYACGVDIVGPSNIFTLLESIPPYWEAGRAMLYEMVGDPSTEDGKKLIRQASPLFHVDKIVKPLLVIQGANDPRVKQAEADQIVIALRDKGKKVDYLLAKDEGHGFYKPLNSKAMYAGIEKFLSEVIGTPYQKDMPQDVGEKLKELTVDVSKVKYEVKKDLKAEKTLPPIVNPLIEINLSYDVLLEVQGQKIPMTMVRSIKKIGNDFEVEDISKSPMGEMKDKSLISPDFKLKTRTMSQNGQDATFTFTENSCTGSLMGKTLDIKWDGATIYDGSIQDLMIAGLPLDDGYSIVCNMPDIMSGKAKLVQINCLGMDNGMRKVEIINTDNATDITTMWIDTKYKLARKMTAVIPAMGNALMTITMK